MEAESISIYADYLNPARLLGPIFDKELRVSSRRRRNYFLRFAYVFLLMFFVVGTWLSFGQLQGSMAFQKSRLAEIGKSIVETIVLFQFFAAQIIAVILLSNSISDELYHRTLGVLMTTPINSLQIVIGKLFSKLLQIIILLSISFPILAIVRVFGGVSWSYLFSSFCITLCAAIFAGSISLAFSIKNVHTYVVVIKTVFTLAIIYIGIPVMFAAIFQQQLQWLFNSNYSGRSISFPFLAALLHTNPLAAIYINTSMMISPTAASIAPFFYWPLHCILTLMASALILAFTVKVIRKVALRQILGELDLFSKIRMSLSKKNGKTRNEYEGIIREVSGLPVFWKEVRKPLIQGIDNTNSKIGLAFTIITLLITYLICYKENCFNIEAVHVSYVLMFVIVGMIFNIVLAVSCITSERESMALPILLTTSLDDWQIVQGKALGVFYKCMPIWLLLAGHVMLFILAGYIHPIAIIQIPIIITGLLFFLTGLGLYASSRFKRTTWAIIICFAFLLVIWLVVPIIFGIITQIARHYNEKIFGLYYSSNPIIQIGIVVNSISADNASLSLSNLHYLWPFARHSYGVYATTGLLLFIMSSYIVLGLFFAWMAKKRIRQNIF